MFYNERKYKKMNAREKLHYILDNGTDRQIDMLIALLLLEQREVFSQDDHPEECRSAYEAAV